MNRACRAAVALTVVVAVSGCYNARVNTGLPPGPQVIEENWAPSWIFGAVSPPAVNAASRCANGVAQVHTYHSFLNMVVASLTGGIFTPITIHVTCASGEDDAEDGAEPGSAEVRIDGNAGPEEQVKQFQAAVDLSARTGKPVSIRFD